MSEELELVVVPLARLLERRASNRYSWCNVSRVAHPVILQYTVEGMGAFEFDGTTYPVPPGFALISVIPENSRYFYPQNGHEAWAFRWIDMDGNFAIRLWKGFRERFGPVVSLPLSSPAELLLRQVIQMVEEQSFPDPISTGELIYQFYLAWCRQLLHRRMPSGEEDATRAAEKFCRQHFRRPINVKEVAAQVGLSREHLSRHFSKQFGIGPAEYLRQLRVQEARRLVESTRMPLKEVAFRCGFSNARNLSVLLQSPGVLSGSGAARNSN